MIILFFIFVLVLFYCFNGCILTLLELKLCKDDNYTVIDIVLELFDIELNNKTRTKYSYILIIKFANMHRITFPLTNNNCMSII